jgi:hypothetical protein
VRRLLQVLGTEVGREMIDPNVWINIAQKRIHEHWTSNRKVVITAIRFPNELEMIRSLGGTSIWIERPTEQRGAIEELSGHASETSVSQELFDYTIVNDQDLENLYDLTERALTHISYQSPLFGIAVGEDYQGWPTYDR